MPDKLEKPLANNCDREKISLINSTLDAAPKSPDLIQNLFPEILGNIFQYACPAPVFQGYTRDYYQTKGAGSLTLSRRHFSLAAVSSTWRQVVYSTPQLWTSVALTHDDVELLELHIVRSGSLLLELEIWNSLAGWDALPKVAPKLKSLVLANLEADGAEYISNLEFPSLKRLGILCRGREIRCLKLAGAPVLQHLSINGSELYFNILDFELPWPSIKSLDFDWIPFLSCMTALRQCRGLVEFRFQEVYGSAGDILEAPLTLPSLKRLYWPYPRHTTAHNLLQHLRTPALQSLLLGHQQPVDQAWFYFFQNLPPTLRKLHLYGFIARTTRDISYPACFFEHVPHLEELVVEGCEKRFIDDVLATLSLYESSTGGPIYLPKLRTLVVGPPSSEFSGHEMIEMIEKRFAGRVTCSVPTVTREGGLRYSFRAFMVVIESNSGL